MQASGLNALLAMAAAPAGASSPSAASVLGEGDEQGLGQQFSQLLGDSGHSYDGQQAAQQFTQGALLQATPAGILAGQEVPCGHDPMAGLGDKLVAPGDVADLVAQLDQLMAEQDGNAADVPILTADAAAKIKEQLLAIEKTGEPKSLAAILASVPEVKASRLAQFTVLSALGLKRTEFKQDEKEAPGPVAALQQQVQALMFRAPRAADTKAPAATGQEEKTEDRGAVGTVTVIEPLAAVSTQAVAVPAQPSQAMLADNAPPGARDVHWDDVIPSLKLPKEKGGELPAVDLPSMGAEKQVTNDTLRSASPSNTTARLEALSDAANAMAAVDTGKAVDAVPAAGDKSAAAITNLFNPSHAGGHSPTQTATAAQPISLIPTHGYINHAPVTDQVHVALHQASKDGIDRLTIQLDPVDLGRVEVKMHTDQHGQTQISFLVDKPETFDSLSRDARMLERSLQEAGIKADAGSMQFNLRQQPQPQLHSDLNGQGQPNQQQAQAETPANDNSTVANVALPVRNYLFNVREGVDISA